MNKKNVAVIFGGQSSEHEVSKKSAKTVLSNISTEKYNIIPIYITKEGKWLLYEGPIESIFSNQWEVYGTNVILSPDETHKGLVRIVGDKIKFMPIDVIFPVLHGKYGEDGTIQGLFEITKIPYVGCGVLASSLAMDKSYTKAIIDGVKDVNQAKYVSFKSYDLNDEILLDIEEKLGYPCFVKPANAGSSIGIAKVTDKKSLKNAIKNASKHDRTIIVEEYIKGREIECAILGNKELIVSVLGEVVSGAEFYDYDAKYNNEHSKTIIPADVPENVSEEIFIQAKKIFKALNCLGLSRIDFFVEDDTNKIIFNEINTLPGFTSISMYSMLFEKSGIKINHLIDKLLTLAIERYKL